MKTNHIRVRVYVKRVILKNIENKPYLLIFLKLFPTLVIRFENHIYGSTSLLKKNNTFQNKSILLQSKKCYLWNCHNSNIEKKRLKTLYTFHAKLMKHNTKMVYNMEHAAFMIRLDFENVVYDSK